MGSKKSSGGTCADEHAATVKMFEPGDVVRLKSECRFMTVHLISVTDVTCLWMDGSKLEEGDFHRDCLTKEPYPEECPF